jgi:hypothetical protein
MCLDYDVPDASPSVIGDTAAAKSGTHRNILAVELVLQKMNDVHCIDSKLAYRLANKGVLENDVQDEVGFSITDALGDDEHALEDLATAAFPVTLRFALSLSAEVDLVHVLFRLQSGQIFRSSCARCVNVAALKREVEAITGMTACRQELRLGGRLLACENEAPLRDLDRERSADGVFITVQATRSSHMPSLVSELQSADRRQRESAIKDLWDAGYAGMSSLAVCLEQRTAEASSTKCAEAELVFLQALAACVRDLQAGSKAVLPHPGSSV